jgi:uncharacterized protein YjeT (DUF2065 family)
VFQLSRFPPIYQSIPENMGFLLPATVLHRGFFLTRPRPAVYIPPPKDETAIMPDGKQGSMKFFICVLGMVMIIEGLPYFAFPEKMKRWMLQIQEMSDDALRRFGLLLMLGGLALAYIGKAG